MSDPTQNAQQKTGAVQTTGHAWDGDLQEYNNPLPRWWLWCFYGTVVFSILYWLVYPSWPVGQSWLKGFGTIEYTTVDKATGKERANESRWNTRALLLEDLGAAATDEQRKAMLAKVQATNAVYTESGMSLMTPPHATDLATLRDRGAKMLVYHYTDHFVVVKQFFKKSQTAKLTTKRASR